MIAITRGRIAAAAGILTLSGLLGAAVAVPAPHDEVKTTAQDQGTPNKYAGIKLASVPAPWDSIKLTQWEEGTPRPWDTITLTSVQKSVPPPFEDG